MPYKDPAVQRQYQHQWRQNRRQQRVHARQEHLLTLAVWHTQVQNVHAACEVAQQTLRQIEPDLTRDAMAGRMRVPVAEIMWLLGGIKACLYQTAKTLTEFESYHRRLQKAVPEGWTTPKASA